MCRIVSILTLFPASGMAGLRKILSPKCGLICVVVLLVLFGLSLSNKFHSAFVKPLGIYSTHLHRNQIPDRGRNISSQSMSSRLKLVPNAAPLYTDDIVMAALFWKRIDAMITNDNLYSDDYNVSMVVNVLRHAKLVKADLFLVKPVSHQPCGSRAPVCVDKFLDFVRQPHGVVYYTARLPYEKQCRKAATTNFRHVHFHCDLLAFSERCTTTARHTRLSQDCCKTRKVFVRLTL